MRGRTVVVALVAVAACQREPTFEERYRTTQNAIVEEAHGIDADLNAADRAIANQEEPKRDSR